MTMHLRPDPRAKELAEKMVMAEHTMHEILEETVSSAENGEVLESGRTVCGSITTAEHPIQRFPKSVDLESCPRGVSGTWHSHVRQSELLEPEHSLPDMANVVFGAVDSSVVVGARRSDVFMASDDRDAMRRSFQNVLGLDVQGTSGVVEAIEDGEITDYGNVRDRVRSEFSGLFRTVDMPFGTMEQRVREIADAGKISPYAPASGTGAFLEPMYAHDQRYEDDAPTADRPRGGDTRRTERVRGRFRDTRGNLPDVGGLVAESAIGSVVGLATRRLVRSISE